MVFRLFDPQKFSQSVIWNLLLLTAGSFLFAAGAQGIAACHGFLTGGIYGTGILLWFVTDALSPSIWYALLSVPLFLVAWFNVGRNFLLYTLYATCTTILFGQFISFRVPIEDPLYASVAAGVICGAGGGIQLRTMGCGGGLDLVGVILNRRWNVGVGRFSFIYNAVLFTIAGGNISLDMVIVSFIQVVIASAMLEYVLRLFNQRKLVYVVTEHGEEICSAILAKGYSGATRLQAKGAYSRDPREIIMTVTNNILLRKLESMVYELDPHALFIVENTFYVSGARYPRKSVI